jgi:hypothetical protein
MIVNELALSPGGLGREAAFPADLIRRVSQAQPARTDPPLTKARDTSNLHGQHKIISDGKIIAVAVGKTKNSWLLTPRTSAAGPPMCVDVQISLKATILDLSVFRRGDSNGVQNGGQTHSS